MDTPMDRHEIPVCGICGKVKFDIAGLVLCAPCDRVARLRAVQTAMNRPYDWNTPESGLTE